MQRFKRGSFGDRCWISSLKLHVRKLSPKSTQDDRPLLSAHFQYIQIAYCCLIGSKLTQNDRPLLSVHFQYIQIAYWCLTGF